MSAQIRAVIAASPPPCGASTDAQRSAGAPEAQKIAIAIPDGTRPVLVAEALAALAEWLTGDVTVVVGLGLHRKMRPEELPESPWPIVQHDPDDTVRTAVIDGIPGGVGRAIAQADVVLGIGIVEPHQYAGFSGGHKAVAVGCGARATLDALHHRDRVIAPGVEVGRLEGNPFRAAVDGLGRAARCTWTLLQTGAGAEARWFAGEPIDTLRRAAASLDCWEAVDGLYDAAILRVPATKAVNFYQASRAATYLGLSARPPLSPGATLFLEARCPEGMGEGSGELAFARVLGAGEAPWGHLLDGPAPTGAGTQRAVVLALLLRRFNLVICGVDDPRPFQAVGLAATTAPAEAVAPAGALDVRDPFGRIPQGG